MSMAAGVNASTSEIRPPVDRNVRQNSAVRGGALRGFHKAQPLGGIEIFAATGRAEERYTLVMRLVHGFQS